MSSKKKPLYLSNFKFFNTFICSILSRIISVSDEIQQFRKNLVEQHSASQKSLPESVRRELSERNQSNPNIRQLSNNRESRSGDDNAMTPDKENNVNKGETENKISSGIRCTESNASLEQTQNISSEKVKHTSDDPSAPIYPPRSPTSDIVPTELPPCHVLSAKAFLAENTNMCQVDGNAEIPINKELPSSVILDQTEKDIMVLFDKSNKLPKNISHSSSSSSVSSNGSRASSSVRESMSDTVSIQSCNSSGYGSESFENNFEVDSKGPIEVLHSISNTLHKSDYSYYPTYTENSISYFDSVALQNHANTTCEKIDNSIKTLDNYEPIHLGIAQPFLGVYEYHDGNLILVTKCPQSQKVDNLKDLSSSSEQYFSCNSTNNSLHSSNEDVLAIQSLLQNVEISKK